MILDLEPDRGSILLFLLEGMATRRPVGLIQGDGTPVHFFGWGE